VAFHIFSLSIPIVPGEKGGCCSSSKCTTYVIVRESFWEGLGGESEGVFESRR